MGSVPVADLPYTDRGTGPPPTTPELRTEARQQMAKDTIGSLFLFSALAEGAGRFLYPRSKGGAEVVAKDISGFELEPVPGTPRARPRLGLVSLFGLAPVPVGYVPPEVYGLRPDFVVEKEKRKSPEHRRDIGLFFFRQLGADPGGPREAYANAKEADLFRDYYTARLQFRSDRELRTTVLDPQTAITPTPFFYYRPEEIRLIAAQELQRRGAPLPPLPPGVFNVVPDGTVHPALVQPVTDAAKAIQDAATGILKELVSERADP